MVLLGLRNAELSIVFVGNKKMRYLNSEFRNIDKITDVLSFPQEIFSADRRININRKKTKSPQSLVLGDVVICVPRAITQAEELGFPFYYEIMRLIIHGLLHLIGYDHEAGIHRKKMMVKKEKELLHAVTKVA